MKSLKNKKIIFVLGLVPVLAIGGFLILRGKAVETGSNVSEQRTAVAERGTLEVTLSGSGTVSPAQRKEIIVRVDGEVKESYLEPGKAVKEGDILLTLSDTEAQLAIKKLENTLEQKEASLSDEKLENGSLGVTAPISGRVAAISVKAGDTVNKGALLLTIVDEKKLKARVTFENASLSQFNGKKTVQLQIPDFMTSLTARIVSLSANGSDIDALLEADNPGELKSGMTAYAELECAGETLSSTQGTLEFQNQEVVKAPASGTVANLSAFNDQLVNAGKLLLTLSGEDLAYSVESERLELEQARLELQKARENLDNYTIRAPFDGIIASAEKLSAGDSLKGGTSVGVILNNTEMTFDVNIDELDIASVKTGQKAYVTVEALEETTLKPIEGVVTEVASEGTSNNGVTSYPVTIAIPGNDNLKSGMNVDAAIQVLNKENALLVPFEAVQKMGDRYIVWVKREGQQADNSMPVQGSGPESNAAPQGGGQTIGKDPTGGQIDFKNMTDEERQALRQRMQGRSGVARQGGASSAGGIQTGARIAKASGYYEGAVPVIVKVGQHNETMMEILEGISEGEVVVLPPVVAGTSTSTNQKSVPGGNFIMPMGGAEFRGNGVMKRGE